MITTIKVEKEIYISHVRIRVPVTYSNEEVPADLPFLSKHTWDVLVNIDTGKIEEWPDNPKFAKCKIDLKVCDEGTYTLFSSHGYGMHVVAKLQEYVPNGLIPGRYGDYIELEIENGVITNWPKKPDVSAFFES